MSTRPAGENQEYGACGPRCRGLCSASGYPQGKRYVLLNCEPPPESVGAPADFVERRLAPGDRVRGSWDSAVVRTVEGDRVLIEWDPVDAAGIERGPGRTCWREAWTLTREADRG